MANVPIVYPKSFIMDRSTHNLSDLIKILVDILAKKGDLPVIYHDQGQACMYHDCNKDGMIDADCDAVYIGGFYDSADTHLNFEPTAEKKSE